MNNCSFSPTWVILDLACLWPWPCQASSVLFPSLAPVKPMEASSLTLTSTESMQFGAVGALCPCKRQVYFRGKDSITLFTTCIPSSVQFFSISKLLFLSIFKVYLWVAFSNFLTLWGSMCIWELCWDLLSSFKALRLPLLLIYSQSCRFSSQFLLIGSVINIMKFIQLLQCASYCCRCFLHQCIQHL